MKSKEEIVDRLQEIDNEIDDVRDIISYELRNRLRGSVVGLENYKRLDDLLLIKEFLEWVLK